MLNQCVEAKALGEVDLDWTQASSYTVSDVWLVCGSPRMAEQTGYDNTCIRSSLRSVCGSPWRHARVEKAIRAARTTCVHVYITSLACVGPWTLLRRVPRAPFVPRICIVNARSGLGSDQHAPKMKVEREIVVGAFSDPDIKFGRNDEAWNLKPTSHNTVTNVGV